MIRLTLQSFALVNPQWSEAALRPGREVTLSADSPDITADQSVRFDIYKAAEWIDTVTSAAGKATAKWIPPNLPGASTLLFHARLIEKPLPGNGQSSVVVSVTSPNATLNGYELKVDTIDAAFVPKQEKLEVAYTVTDANAGAKKGRFEIWGERYPTRPAAPLYAEDFAPAAGAATWTSWSGKANAGQLDGKFLTPEFSPYTLRLIIGPDAASVKDPGGVGQGLVAIAETQFEIIVHSVHIRIYEKLKLQTTLDDYKLDEILRVEPRQPNGDFAFKERLPLPAETGRIRMPMARHHIRGEALDQGGNAIGGGYFGGGVGGAKHTIDLGFYTRPELPLEFEPRLKSRDNTINNDPTKRGLFEKEAIGPLEMEPFADDFYPETRFGDGGAATPHQLFLKNAALKIKKGTHTAPEHNAANEPIFEHWQARFKVTAAGTQDFDVSTINSTTTCKYTRNTDELKVYLNRMLLDRSDRTDDNELTDGSRTYREVASGGGAGTDIAIRLAPDLTKVNDVIWIVRTPTAGGIATWKKFPPGPNCNVHYGGFRGEDPTAQLSNGLRKDYSANPVAPREPIIGKGKAAYRYINYVNLRPEADLPVDEQERAVITALTSGSRRGYSGVIFSPSWIAGDAYVIRAWMDHEPYRRRFGFIQPATRKIDSHTGTIEVWRHLQFANSLRMPGPGAGGLPATAGLGADGGAPYHGDGVNMSFGVINGQFEDARYEWTMSKKGTVHKNIDIKKYRKAHNLYSTGLAGRVPLDKNSDVTNEFSRYDYYRQELPPGIPADRVNVAANAIALLAKGTDSPTAGAAVMAAIAAHDIVPLPRLPDAALDNGVSGITVYGGSAGDYFFQAFGVWKNTIAYPIVDLLTPISNPPRKMNIVRWFNLHESPFWNDATGLVAGTTDMSWEGESMGSGNSIIRAGVLSGTLFAHEMGHSTHLVHFVAGNFGWKHHHLNSPDCFMSYTHTQGFIWKPAGNVGPEAAVGTAGHGGPGPWPLAHGGTDVETGWPHWAETPAGSGITMDCIHFGPRIVLGAMCAKCALKLRGWEEEKIPVAWKHPDLY